MKTFDMYMERNQKDRNGRDWDWGWRWERNAGTGGWDLSIYLSRWEIIVSRIRPQRARTQAVRA